MTPRLTLSAWTGPHALRPEGRRGRPRCGYFTPWICKGIVERGLYGVMGYRRPSHRGYFHKRSTPTIRRPTATAARRVRSSSIAAPTGWAIANTPRTPANAASARSAPLHPEPEHQKLITRHLWQPFKEQIDAHRLTDLGKRLYAPRKETVERSFADAKELLGIATRFRGLAKVQAQCLLSAACQNMKKIALLLTRRAAALCKPEIPAFRRPERRCSRQHIISIPNRPGPLWPLPSVSRRPFDGGLQVAQLGPPQS